MNYPDFLLNAQKSTHEEVKAMFLERSRELCPVRTGKLRGSIEASPTKVQRDGLVSYVGTDVVYAPYVEYGTSRMSAQSFIRKAGHEIANTIGKSA